MIKVMCICGARPNFMKVAPLAQAFATNGAIELSIVHTGQHYDEKMSDEQRNAYENLILICGDCHTKIDKQPNTYTAQHLLEIKQSHESWIMESTQKEMVNITFIELEVVTKYLLSNEYEITESLEVVPPREKIKRNKCKINVGI